MQTLKTCTIVAILALFLSISIVGSAFAAAQTTCPVMGGTINKEIYADYKGERVYFCCLGCPPEFKKNPEKYLKKLKEMGQEPEKINTDTDTTKK